jgi:hypothetical protein
VVSICVSVTAQNSGFYWDNLKEFSNRLQGKIMGEIFYIDPLSSQFFFLQDDWVKGTIELVDGDVYENIDIRYNSYTDQLIAYNSRIRTLYTVDKNIVNRFSFKDYFYGENFKMREFVKLDCNKLHSGVGFFEQLYKGNTMLLAFHHIDELKVSPYVDRLGRMNNVEYKKRVDYYLYDSKKEFKKVSIKRRSILKAFPENKKEIKKTLRQSKIVLQNKDTLIQAIGLIDQAGFIH